MFWISTALSLAAFALFGALCAILWRSIRGADRLPGLIAMATLLATPIGIPYYVSNSQYLEVVNLVLLAVYGLAAVGLRRRPALVFPILVACCGASILVHESALVSTVPVMLALYYLTFTRARVDGRLLAGLAGVFGACLLVVLAAGARSPRVSPEVVMAIASRITPDFAISAHDVRVLDRSLGENVRYAFGEYASVAGGSRIVLSLVTTLPAMCFLSALIRRRFDDRLSLAVIGVGLMPLGLTLIADDVFRWYVIAIVGLGLLALMPAADALARVAPVRPSPRALLPLGLVALLAGAVVPYPYFMAHDGHPLLAMGRNVGSGVKSSWEKINHRVSGAPGTVGKTPTPDDTQ